MTNWLWWLWRGVEAVLPLVALIGLIGTLAALIARSAAKSYVEGRIQHGFAKDLEAVKAELRQTEEGFKSRLRIGEAQITALQSALLNGRSHRLSLLDKRRMEAVEAIWSAVGKLAPLKNLAAQFSVVLPMFTEEDRRDPKVREFVARLLPKSDGSPEGLQDRPVGQPFVSPSHGPTTSPMPRSAFTTTCLPSSLSSA